MFKATNQQLMWCCHLEGFVSQVSFWMLWPRFDEHHRAAEWGTWLNQQKKKQPCTCANDRYTVFEDSIAVKSQNSGWKPDPLRSKYQGDNSYGWNDQQFCAPESPFKKAKPSGVLEFRSAFMILCCFFTQSAAPCLCRCQDLQTFRAVVDFTQLEGRLAGLGGGLQQPFGLQPWKNGQVFVGEQQLCHRRELGPTPSGVLARSLEVTSSAGPRPLGRRCVMKTCRSCSRKPCPLGCWSLEVRLGFCVVFSHRARLHAFVDARTCRPSGPSWTSPRSDPPSQKLSL